jgi:hypothetical protein
MGPPDRMGVPGRDDRDMAPPLPPRPLPAQAGPPRDPYGRFEEHTGGFSGFDAPRREYETGPSRRPPAGPSGPPAYGQDDRERFEPGRHGKVDMTAEIRLPDRDRRMPGAGLSGPGMPAPGVGGPAGGPAPGGGAIAQVDQIRRSLQARRFGSGYDPNQVNQFFDLILTAMSGRGPMPVSVADLETTRFGLVQGGYFEAEVEAALREVKEILRRR